MNTYHITIYTPNGPNEFSVNGKTLKEAKNKAQHVKRMHKYKGVTFVQRVNI